MAVHQSTCWSRMVSREKRQPPPRRPPPTAEYCMVCFFRKVTPQNVTVGAGGAVIALSEVDDEYEEMLLKATSVLGALGHEKRPGRRGPPGSEPTRFTERLPSSSRPEAPVVLPGDNEKKEGVAAAVQDSIISPANSVIGGGAGGVRPQQSRGGLRGVGLSGEQRRAQRQQQAGGD